MGIKVIYEDNDILVIDKPAGIVVYPEGKIKRKTLIDLLLEKYPDLRKVDGSPRYGIVHRLDKDTSGILLVARNNKSLVFLQKQFKKGEVKKKYTALVTGKIKESKGEINTLIGRSPKNGIKQKAYLPLSPGSKGKRKAVTKYKVIKKFKGYTLLEIVPETGRKHQIRCHLAYLSHPIAGDKMYGFKNQPYPEGLNRQFLHANFLRIKMPDRKTKEFKSDLPKDLKRVLEKLK